MASKKRDFYGKEVTDAIKKACDKLGVPQEQLEIEVVETGSTGIFGLIRKKAHIRAYVKEAGTASAGKERQKPKKKEEPERPATGKTVEEQDTMAVEKASQAIASPEAQHDTDASPETAPDSREQESAGKPAAVQEAPPVEEQQSASEEKTEEQAEEISEDVVNLVKEELGTLLKLMGYPSEIDIVTNGSALTCKVSETHEAVLTGEDGKTLDSLQYLLRKIVARKVPNRLRLTVDVGNYRERRLDELKERAAELAARVKEDGKTQVIAALSPSERRVIHMSLQDDKEIRSRSVGEGLFKKILIYKPGKGGKGGGRKRNSGRGRRTSNNRRKNS